ncbi:MAG: isochorismatase family protein [Deltaproteobacteria bacterium]|nr:isochorismatase family protein [Deltaproteobacteria bacterium]
MTGLFVRPSTTALLVVDVQERLLPAMPRHEQTRLIACNELLLEAAKRFGMLTHFTEQYPRGLGPTVVPLRAYCTEDDDRVGRTEKTTFSAMDSPTVQVRFQLAKVDTVIVTGMEAHVCVFQTVRALLGLGLHVHVPFDAVASRDPEAKRTALALLSSAGAHITTTETVVFDLLQDAQHPHFKALSALVKNLPMGPNPS